MPRKSQTDHVRKISACAKWKTCGGVMMTKKRGFAAMPMHRQLEIAAAGGRAAQASGKAHHWTREEARIAAGRDGRPRGLACARAFASDWGVATHAQSDVTPLAADGIGLNPASKGPSSCVDEPPRAALSSVPRSPIGPFLVKLFAAPETSKTARSERKRMCLLFGIRNKIKSPPDAPRRRHDGGPLSYVV